MCYKHSKYKSHIYWYFPTFLLQREVANNEKKREVERQREAEKRKEAEDKKEQDNVQDTRNESPPNNDNVPRNINENDAVPVKQPPKIHFDDGVGAIIAPEDDKKDENNNNIMEGKLVSDSRTSLLI